MEWMRANSQSILNEVGISFEGPDLQLGSLLDSTLNFSIHMLVVARSAFREHMLVCQLHPFLEQADMAMLTHALMKSRFDYFNTLHLELPFGDDLEIECSLA